MTQQREVVQIVNGWPRVDVGRMRHPIILRRLTPASPPAVDAAGPVYEPVTVAEAMAAIEVEKGTDTIRAGQVSTQSWATITMWYQDGITADLQVVALNGAVYQAQAVENVCELDVVLQLRCQRLS